jgi:hypothetical protein
MAITETQSISGRGGSMKVNGVTIAITEWSGKLHKEFAISTDSNNYDPVSGQLYRSRAPGEIWIEFSAKGNYDMAGTTDTNFSQKWKQDGPWPVVLGLTSTTNWGSFSADLDDLNFSLSVPGATMTTFDISGQSNGIPIIY